ncbi:hypothetical protein C0995_014943 [Termitomyces sp. Mi166|nr:hypothetical protein C0995_014943 [Termitomyces sp. Mi166\
MSSHPMLFPVEVLSKIIREATLVPEALDTSPFIFHEDRHAIVQLVCDSMITKTALSAVSKTFHNIMERYLYEVVIIFQFEYVPILLKWLKSIPPGFRTPRRHRCRRLDFYLGVRESHPYKGNAWYEGDHTLWGLLEACCIIHATRFDPDNDVFDDEEPKERVITKGSCRLPLEVKDDWDYFRSSGWFDAATISESKAAKEDFQWPPFSASAPYTIPSLHTLRLDEFDLRLFQQCNFPRLRHLDITHYNTYNTNGDEEDLSKAYGLFPASFTHLVYAGDSITMDGFCPHLRSLTLSIEVCDFATLEFNEPYPDLEVFELAIWSNTRKPESFVEGILDAVSNKRLPGLRIIQITRYLTESSRFRPPQDSEAFGVAIKEVHRRQPLLSSFEMRHC